MHTRDDNNPVKYKILTLFDIKQFPSTTTVCLTIMSIIATTNEMSNMAVCSSPRCCCMSCLMVQHCHVAFIQFNKQFRVLKRPYDNRHLFYKTVNSEYCDSCIGQNVMKLNEESECYRDAN